MAVLGVDVGGVILDRADDDTDTSFFGDNYLESSAVPGALDALRELGRARFRESIHVVSKCGPAVERKTREWLRHHRFHEATGITPERLHFVRTREAKAPVCAQLGITHFIDDHADVLEMLTGVPSRILFTGGGPDGWRPGPVPPGAEVAASWDEVLRLLLNVAQPGDEAGPGAGLVDRTSGGRGA